MTRQHWNDRGTAPLLQSACAVIGSLLLVGLLAYAFAAGEWNFAGEPPAEIESATMWQQWNTPSAPTDDAITIAKRRRTE